MKKIVSLLLIYGAIMFGSVAYAEGQGMNDVFGEIDKDGDRLVGLFKKVHSDPELSFMEVNTAALVDAELQRLGYRTITKIGKTGVVGIMKNGEGPIVMYRADMDALPVKETVDISYASKKISKFDDGLEVPVMHACGHDAHVVWMLGVAKVMAENKDKWKGTLIFVAQPAEEVGEGAQAMVHDQMYSRGVPVPDYLFGMHTAPFPVGTFLSEPGVRMAGTDQIDITFHGIGGHGSSPHLAKDPVIMAATAINSYQSIVSRGIDPQRAAVITVGSVQAGESNNVIPSSALLKINLRWFEEKDRQLMISGIQRINEGIAYSYNLEKSMYPTMVKKGWAAPVVNDPQLTGIVNTGLQNHFPEAKNIVGTPAVMGSEDFHHLVLENPNYSYTFMLVGIADPVRYSDAVKAGLQFPYAPHNSNFVVDLRAIPYGVKLASVSLFSIFQNKSN